MNNSIKAQTKIPWLTEGLLVAGIPIVAYLLKYSYELGYADAFSIPWELITIDLPNILLLSVNLMLAGVVVLFLIAISMPFFKGENVILRSLIKSLFSILIILPWLVLSMLRHDKVILFLAVGFFLLVQYGLFVSPLLTQRGKMGYAARLAAAEFKLKRLMNFLDYSFGWKLKHLIVVIFVLVSLVASIKLIGESVGIGKVTFMVNKSSPEMVVLRVYGDKLICAPFDRTTKEVKRTFTILKTGDDPNLQLSLEKVGPLHVEKEPAEVSRKSVGVSNDSLEGLNKK
jgi:multidrug efflux pump subunit AcrB